MRRKKLIWLSVVTVLLVPAILDAVRYLKPDEEQKQIIQPANTFAPKAATEIVLVYNAWSGIYPAVADFINKEFFPASYPCNLCYQTFGTFSMKEEWRLYLDSLPYKKTELHIDNFKRRYKPVNMELPVILLANENNV